MSFEVARIELIADYEAYLSGITRLLPEDIYHIDEVSAVKEIERVTLEESLFVPQGIKYIGKTLLEWESGPVLLTVNKDKLPDPGHTPERYVPPDKARIKPSNVWQMILAANLGKMYGISNIRSGRIISDVFPRAGFEEVEDSAFGSNKRFDLHSDVVIYPNARPDIISLKAQRNVSKPTLISGITESEIPSDFIEILRKPLFRIFLDGSKNPLKSLVMPIIEDKPEGGRMQLNYFARNKISVEPNDQEKEANEALDFLIEKLDKNTVEVMIETGSILLLNNRSNIVHGRKEFNLASNSNNNRWLSRLYIASRQSLVDQVNISPNRVVDPS